MEHVVPASSFNVLADAAWRGTVVESHTTTPFHTSKAYATRNALKFRGGQLVDLVRCCTLGAHGVVHPADTGKGEGSCHGTHTAH